MPGVSALDWKADALVDLDEGLTEDDDPDVSALLASPNYLFSNFVYLVG